MWQALFSFLFPSWEFFDKAGASLTLEKKVGEEWVDCLNRFERNEAILAATNRSEVLKVYNNWNHYLFRYSLFERQVRLWSFKREKAAETESRRKVDLFLLKELQTGFDFSATSAIRVGTAGEEPYELSLEAFRL